MSKSLTDTLNFWDKVKYGWVSAFEFNLHNITRSKLAEAAQTSMKGADEINVSLVDAALIDSARLQAKWENRINGERCTGRGPSPLELSERSSRRQIRRAHHFTDEEKKIFTITEELPVLTLPLSHSSQPSKAEKKIEIS